MLIILPQWQQKFSLNYSCYSALSGAMKLKQNDTLTFQSPLNKSNVCLLKVENGLIHLRWLLTRGIFVNERLSTLVRPPLTSPARKVNTTPQLFFIALLLGSIAETMLVKHQCYSQTKLYRLYRNLIISGHFSIIYTFLGSIFKLFYIENCVITNSII